ncbi:MAG: hypothetical protein KAI47_02715, partial [Deltaproteobacteria bacterium]|nr:hypothetical protein [Deltaproteobacteria bacterium]
MTSIRLFSCRLGVLSVVLCALVFGGTSGCRYFAGYEPGSGGAASDGSFDGHGHDGGPNCPAAWGVAKSGCPQVAQLALGRAFSCVL